MRLSLRWKLALAVGIPVALGGAAVTAVGHYRLRAAAFQEMTLRAQTQASAFAGRFDAQLTAVAQVARSAAEFLSAHPGLPERDLYDLAARNVRQGDLAFGANQRDPVGLIYGSCLAFEPNTAPTDAPRERFAPYVYTPEPDRVPVAIDVAQSYDYTARKWDWYYIPKQTGQAIWTEPFEDTGAGNIVMCTYSAPIFRDGKFAGVATVDLPLDRLQLLIRNKTREIGREGGFIIISKAGKVISAEDPEPDPKKKIVGRMDIFDWARGMGRNDLVELGRRMVDGGSGAVIVPGWENREVSGKPELGNQLLYYAPIPSTGWSFVASVPEREIMAPVFGHLRERAAFSLLATMAGVGMAIGIASWITRPISRLSRAVRDLAAGNLDAHTSIDAGDEIGDLSRAFNTMVGDLRQRMDELTRETAARESVESELRVARTIQESLLPREFPPFPDRPEFNLHALNAAARHMAGDFYDFFMPDAGRLVLIIADVSGKGAPAAVFMAVTRTILRDLARNHPNLHTGALLTEANRILLENNTFGMFVTLWFGLYDINTGVMRYANAGHPHPFLVSSSAAVTRFGEVTGPILGILDDAAYEEREITVNPGDTLVFYTDGVPEARRPAPPSNGAPPLKRTDADQGFFGLPRFERLLAAIANTTPTDYHLAERYCTRIVEEIDRFQANDRADDITVMTLRRVR